MSHRENTYIFSNFVPGIVDGLELLSDIVGRGRFWCHTKCPSRPLLKLRIRSDHAASVVSGNVALTLRLHMLQASQEIGLLLE